MKLRVLLLVAFTVSTSLAQISEKSSLFNKSKKTGIIIINEGISAYIVSPGLNFGMLTPKGLNSYETNERKRYKEALEVVENRLNVKNLFLQTYKSIYEKKGIDIIKIKGKLTLEYLDSFKKPRRSKKKYSKYDFRFIKEKYNIDQLIVADVKYGLLLNNKNGICEIITRVIDLDDNSLLHIDSSVGNIDVEGKWKIPPDYDNLYNAIRKAIENAILLEKIKFR